MRSRATEVARDAPWGALGAAGAALVLVPDQPQLYAAAAAFAGTLGAAAALRHRAAWVTFLPVTARLWPAAPVTLGVGVVAALGVAQTGSGASAARWLAVWAIGAVVAVLAAAVGRRLAVRRPRTRLAVVGSEATARRLAADLDEVPRAGFTVVGRVGAGPGLGDVDGLRELVLEHDIDVVVLSREAPRLVVFEQLVSGCLDLPLRTLELSACYETVFGHVPTADINAAWWQHRLRLESRRSPLWPKRALDLAGAVVLGVIALPLLAGLALIIRSDGGPVLFRQQRIGAGGRPFGLIKLRTMHEGVPSRAQWAAADDPRVTRIGRFLRRTHLDELPQLVNVLRGEMSLVGPRPEQPEFVVRLERTLPFYQRRHLERPGITGWGQVRAGYARSDFGSAVKLSHDLYYLEHRSFGLDVLILLETLLTLGRSTVTATLAARAAHQGAEPARPWHGVAPPAHEPAAVAVGAAGAVVGDPQPRPAPDAE